MSDTLTSEVETTSTATRCRSKAAKIELKKPCASCMRGAATSTMVMRFLTAMALNEFRQRGVRAVIRVPSQTGRRFSGNEIIVLDFRRELRSHLGAQDDVKTEHEHVRAQVALRIDKVRYPLPR